MLFLRLWSIQLCKKYKFKRILSLLISPPKVVYSMMFYGFHLRLSKMAVSNSKLKSFHKSLSCIMVLYFSIYVYIVHVFICSNSLGNPNKIEDVTGRKMLPKWLSTILSSPIK